MILHHSGHIGGAGVSLIHILKSLKNLDYEIEVVCPKKPEHMMLKIKAMGISVSPLNNIPIIEHYSGLERNILNPKNIKNLKALMKFRNQFKNMLLKSDPDLVFLNSMTLCYLGKTIKSLNKKAVCFHRETYAKGFLELRTKWIKRMLNKYFDKVVFISEFDKTQTKGIQDKGEVIYDKVDLEEDKDNYEIDKDLTKPFKILYVGGISRLKGAHVLLNSIKDLEVEYKLIFLQYNLRYKRPKKLSDCITIKEKIKYILDLDYTKKVLKIIEDNNLWDKIEFHQSQHNVIKYFKESDVVVFPAMSPHQARPIYEAGAVKKPIIITSYNNIKEFVIDKENGILFNRGDSNQLTENIMTLANNEDLLSQMGEKNYERTMSKHNYTSLEKELSNLLKKLM